MMGFCFAVVEGGSGSHSGFLRGRQFGKNAGSGMGPGWRSKRPIWNQHAKESVFLFLVDEWKRWNGEKGWRWWGLNQLGLGLNFERGQDGDNRTIRRIEDLDQWIEVKTAGAEGLVILSA